MTGYRLTIAVGLSSYRLTICSLVVRFELTGVIEVEVIPP